MKKRYIVLAVVVLVFIQWFASHFTSLDYRMAHESQFWGIVQGGTEDYVVVAVNADEDIYSDTPVVYVSRYVINKDGKYYEDVGDEVIVIYDGTITDTDPPKAETVYGILLINPAHRGYG